MSETGFLCFLLSLRCCSNVCCANDFRYRLSLSMAQDSRAIARLLLYMQSLNIPLKAANQQVSIMFKNETHLQCVLQLTSMMEDLAMRPWGFYGKVHQDALLSLSLSLHLHAVWVFSFTCILHSYHFHPNKINKRRRTITKSMLQQRFLTLCANGNWACGARILTPMTGWLMLVQSVATLQMPLMFLKVLFDNCNYKVLKIKQR